MGIIFAVPIVRHCLFFKLTVKPLISIWTRTNIMTVSEETETVYQTKENGFISRKYSCPSKGRVPLWQGPIYLSI